MFFVQRMTSLLSMMYNEAQSLTLLDLVFARQNSSDEKSAPNGVEDFLVPNRGKDEEQPE
jgi:hypothetical protein